MNPELNNNKRIVRNPELNNNKRIVRNPELNNNIQSVYIRSNKIEKTSSLSVLCYASSCVCVLLRSLRQNDKC